MEKFILNCVKSKKLVIAKICVYNLTKDYNSSKILKKKIFLKAIGYVISVGRPKNEICNYYK